MVKDVADTKHLIALDVVWNPAQRTSRRGGDESCVACAPTSIVWQLNGVHTITRVGLWTKTSQRADAG